MRKVAELGCYACEVNGIENHAEIHHIRKHTGMGLRPPHSDTIPLCSIHHRTGKDSIHLGKKLFIKKYGYEKSKFTFENSECVSAIISHPELSLSYKIKNNLI